MSDEQTPTTAPVTVPATTIKAPVVGDGPIHTHAVTYGGLGAVVVGIFLVVAGFVILMKHYGGDTGTATAFFNTGLTCILAGVGGATFGKSPAIR